MLHCLALPVSLLLLPALAELLDKTDTTVHWTLLGFALPVGLWALARGYLAHRRVSILAVGIVGLGGLVLGVLHLFGERFEVPITAGGAFLLLWAHWQNLKQHRQQHGH